MTSALISHNDKDCRAEKLTSIPITSPSRGSQSWLLEQSQNLMRFARVAFRRQTIRLGLTAKNQIFASSCPSLRSATFSSLGYRRPRISLPKTVPVITKRGAPTFPSLGSLFRSTTKAKSVDDQKEDMSYPDEKSNEEWRAVLSPRSYFSSFGYQ